MTTTPELHDSRALLLLAASAVDDLDASACAALASLGLVPVASWEPDTVELRVGEANGVATVHLRDPAGDVAPAVATALSEALGVEVIVLIARGTVTQPELCLRVAIELGALRRGHPDGEAGGQSLGTQTMTSDAPSAAPRSLDELAGAFALIADDLLAETAEEVGVALPQLPIAPSLWGDPAA